MKNIIILIAVYIIGITNVFAQNESDSVKTKSSFFRFNMKERISYEIRAGLNFSTLSTTIPQNSQLQSEFGKSQIKTGANIGILANLPFLESIYFQTGLLFTLKSNSLFCIEYPLLISYRKEIANDLKWNLNFGPYVDFIFGGSEFDNGELGLILGTGVYYKKYYVGIQSDFGLTDVYRGREYNSGNWSNWHIEDMTAKTRVFSIMVGYKF